MSRDCAREKKRIGDHLICFWSLQRQRNLLTRAWMWIAALSFSFCPLLSSLACLALSRNSDLELWVTLNIVHPRKNLNHFCEYKHFDSVQIRAIMLDFMEDYGDDNTIYLRYSSSERCSLGLEAHLTLYLRSHVFMVKTNLPSLCISGRSQ